MNSKLQFKPQYRLHNRKTNTFKPIVCILRGNALFIYCLFLLKFSLTYFILHTFVSKKRYPCYRPWRPIGLREVKAPTLLRQTANRWRQGYQPYAPAALYPQVSSFLSFLILISVRGWVDPRAIVLGQFRNSTSSGLEPATFRLAA
jgi:hypothetical protein